MARRHVLLALALWLTMPATSLARSGNLDAPLAARAQAPAGVSRVLVKTAHRERAGRLIRLLGGSVGRWLDGSASLVALVPDAALQRLAASPDVTAVLLDRPVTGTLQRAAATVGASWVRENLGFTGAGIGVAIVDSGVANWHDDLGSESVVHFVDFVSNLSVGYDDYGHGTHVAGIIAGSGFDSDGAHRGIAPDARLVALKVLDATGDGHISDVIAAIDYAIAQRERFNIRVLNLSVAAGVYESYRTDPLTLAARRAVEAGIVVVTAAGNHGRSGRGLTQSGGITSPGNAPWVLTVGATNQQRTSLRADDAVAVFSSRGPTLIDRAVKPDIVAPGVAIISLGEPGSTLYGMHPESRVNGTVDTAFAPYLSLTGTSMAAPLVTGTIALMLEANPELTPNLVKAILHYTAERRVKVDVSAQGAGFLNARGAVQLAASLADDAVTIDDPTSWSRQVLWGNQRVAGGILTADANAWRSDVMWGATVTSDGDPVVFGRTASDDPWRGDAEADDLEALLVTLPTADGLWTEEALRDEVRAATTVPLDTGVPVVCVPVPPPDRPTARRRLP